MTSVLYFSADDIGNGYCHLFKKVYLNLLNKFVIPKTFIEGCQFINGLDINQYFTGQIRPK